MKIAYLDCFSGVSGDMVVGAFVHAGVPLEVIRNGLALLGPISETLRVEVRSIERSAIHALKFDVLDVKGEPVDRGLGERGPAYHEHGHGHDHEHVHDHGHAHDHKHDDHDHAHGHGHHHHGHAHDGGHHHHSDHDHSHDHEHSHDHGHHHHHGHKHHDHGHHHHHGGEGWHGTHREIVALIDESRLSAGVKERAKAIFDAIAVGEARVHNVPVESVHFHEVGAFDSLADVISVAVCLDYCGIDRLYTSPVPLGSGGMIRTQHGVMPLPAPATLEILKGYPVRMTDVPFELTTPTGAGIVKALSSGTLSMEEIAVERVGFGAGTRELPDRPNLLRVVIGSFVEKGNAASEAADETMTLMETNVDDMDPQAWPHVMDLLFESGALDVWMTPVIMKKGRPGIVLSAIGPDDRLNALSAVVLRETTTIGIRYAAVRRKILPREEIVVDTEFGLVRMKRIASPSGERLVPESDEVRRIARERSMAYHEVSARLGNSR